MQKHKKSNESKKRKKVLVSEIRLHSKRICSQQKVNILESIRENNMNLLNTTIGIKSIMCNNTAIESRDEMDTTSRYEMETTSRDEIESTSSDEIETTNRDEIETTSRDETETTNRDEIETTTRDEIETTNRDKTQATSTDETQATSTDDTTINQHSMHNNSTIKSSVSFGCKKPSSSKAYFVLNSKGISLFIRDNFGFKESTNNNKDYSSQIAIYLKNNFNYKRISQSKNSCPQQRITRSLTTSRSRENSKTSVIDAESSDNHYIDMNDNTSIFNGYFRCYVEDYMVLPNNEQILISIPENDTTFDRYETDGETKFGAKKYRIYCCKIISAPHYHLCQNGMKYNDLNHAFNDGKYGSYVALLQPRLLPSSLTHKLINSGNDACILLTWKEVLNGRMTGIQVWRKRDKPYRDVYSTFKARKKKVSGLKNILNYIYPEVFGDQIQLFHLLNSYYKSNSEYQSSMLKANDAKKNDIHPAIKLQGDTFQSLLQRIDNVFERAIIRTYSSFIVYGKPLLSSSEVNVITNDYISNFSSHYIQMKQMLQFNKKESRMRNYHLSSNNYYNRRLLYTFLSQARIVNSHNLVHFGIVNAGACYGRGLTSKALTLSIHSGISTTYNTMMSKIKRWSDSMDTNLRNILKHRERFVVVMDNNQKGHPIKYQRDGNSNDFIVVTGRMYRDCKRFSIPLNHYQLIADREKSHVNLVYIDQPIPSMYNMPCFEIMDDNNESETKVIINPSTMSLNMGHIDFSGDRVLRYNRLLNICDVVSNVIFKLFTNYNISDTNKQYKEWALQPSEFITNSRKQVTKTMMLLKTRGILKEYGSFQGKVMMIVNPSIKEATKMFIPGVSVRNEITTKGYGMAIIEILVSVGILEERNVCQDGVFSWELCDGYQKKKIILCMDGLSLDRHRSFKKKLMKIPQSFNNNFKQALIFQKALGQIIETSGPLHIAFHMLQTVFDIYKHLITWSISILKWKRIKTNKVSDCFQLSKQLLMLVLNEAERYLIDAMFCYDMDDELKRKCTEDNDTSAHLFAKKYLEFLDDTNWSNNNEYRKMIISFVKTARKFRMYWTAIRSGDRQSQELIFNQWMGVFALLNKHNYLEICINSLEKEYADADYADLEEIRLNGYVRSTEGYDKDDRSFRCVALDEKQEELNADTKQLPIGNTMESWVQHSRNLMFAKSCISHVETNNRRRHLSHSNSVSTPIVARNDNVSDHIRTVLPSATREKIRIYEFLTLLLQNSADRTCQKLSMNHGKRIISLLTTSLGNVNGTDGNTIYTQDGDHLATCIDNIFSENTNMEEDVLNNNENTMLLDDDINNDGESDSTRLIHSNISLVDIFEEGVKHLHSKNIIELRKRRRRRLSREHDFYMKVNDLVYINTSVTNATLVDVASTSEIHDTSTLLFHQKYDALN